MIRWLNEDMSAAWDSHCPWLCAITCEIRDESRKGHIVLMLEGFDFDDEKSYYLDLGDCTGLSDGEINENFAREFGTFVKYCECSGDISPSVVEDLKELNSEFLRICKKGG